MSGLCEITRGEEKVCIAQRTHYLSLDEMTDSHFGHDWNGNCLDNLLDHMWVALEKGKGSQGHML
jgi:hypothetical protein